MSQLTFDDDVGHNRNELEGKYRAWLSDHEQVFELFDRFARQMLERKRRFGIGALTEVVRWEIATSWGVDPDGYKINNNFRAYIARDLIRKHPGLECLIETRAVKNEGSHA